LSYVDSKYCVQNFLKFGNTLVPTGSKFCPHLATDLLPPYSSSRDPSVAHYVRPACWYIALPGCHHSVITEWHIGYHAM